jgi:hypothetical protein
MYISREAGIFDEGRKAGKPNRKEKRENRNLLGRINPKNCKTITIADSGAIFNGQRRSKCEKAFRPFKPFGLQTLQQTHKSQK